MAKRVKYNPLRVDVIFEDERRATWKKVGSNLAVKGIEYTYLVKDRNFDRLNAWKFVVRDPNSYKNDIIVQPISAPNKKVWAGIDRRAIVLVKATKRNHSDKVYCKVNLADPTATRTKIGTSRGERNLLPRWFDYFRRDMRLKGTVAKTYGTDSKAQVVLFNPDDHERMIRLFFALKVWVLQEGFLIED